MNYHDISLLLTKHLYTILRYFYLARVELPNKYLKSEFKRLSFIEE